MQMKLGALSSAGRQLDPNATFRTERNRGQRHDRPGAVPLQSISLRHSGQDQDQLQQSKPIEQVPEKRQPLGPGGRRPPSWAPRSEWAAAAFFSSIDI